VGPANTYLKLYFKTKIKINNYSPYILQKRAAILSVIVALLFFPDFIKSQHFPGLKDMDDLHPEDAGGASLK
jgi:hypothetical protein